MTIKITGEKTLPNKNIQKPIASAVPLSYSNEDTKISEFTVYKGEIPSILATRQDIDYYLKFKLSVIDMIVNAPLQYALWSINIPYEFSLEDIDRILKELEDSNYHAYIDDGDPHQLLLIIDYGESLTLQGEDND